MADIVTGTVSGQVDMTSVLDSVASARREAAKEANDANTENMKGFDRVNADVLRMGADTVKESIKGDWHNSDAIKDSRHATAQAISLATADLSKQVDAVDDTLSAALSVISRESADNRAQITALGFQLRDGFTASAKDAEINSLKTQIETAKQTTYLSDKISNEGEKTRHLVNELKGHDLNRMLIERNALLTDAYADGRHWRDRGDMGQFAAINSQLQAFASQLQETRQGVTNFGTMSGNAGRQQSTNNVA